MGLSGVQRTLKFAKYLPKFGWKPTVLTVGPTGYFAFDESLLREVEEEGIEIVRTSSFDPNRIFKNKGVVKMPPERLRKTLQYFGDWIFIPDTKIGWKRKALKAASGLFATNHFDAVFATAPPQTDFLIGLALKKKFKVPLVLEYRDEWLEYPYKYFPTPFHRVLHKRLERKVVQGCDRIVVTHRRVKENLVKRYPFLSYNDVTIISQGYDPQDFDLPVIPKSGPTDRMRIVHAGTFYGGRNPSVLMQALHNVFVSFPHLRGRFELNLAGNIRKEDQALASKLGLHQDVNFLGYLEHRACVKHLLEADLLWLVLDNDFQSPGKLYEYLGAQKPILASIPEGYLRQLVKEAQAGISVTPGDVKAHEEALVDLLKRFDQKKLPRPAQDVVQRFNRVALSGVLAKLLETLMDIDRNAITRIEEQTA